MAPHQYRRNLLARRRRRRHESKGVTRALIVALFLAPVFMVALIAVGLAFGVQAADSVRKGLPELGDYTERPLAQTSTMFAADGSLLAYLHGEENRTVIPGDLIPKSIKNAVVAIEDERFYEHNGVDPQGILRAMYRNLEAGKEVEGASTITQQLVGGRYLDRTDISLTRKIHEAALAIELEKELSKEEILNQYLNTVYFGSTAYGVQTASRTYFDKEPHELTLAEAALLAGLPQAPSAYSPRNNPAAAKARRDDVLNAMFRNKYITYPEYRKAVATPVELAPVSPYVKVQEPYVVAYVRTKLIEMFGEDAVFKQGLVVQTTINPAYQEHAREAMRSVLNRPGDPAAAIATVDTRTGWVRAMASSTDFQDQKYDLAVQGRRQPGSAFKTFALVAAVEAGADPADLYYRSAPLSIDIPGSREPWEVQTYGHTYSGTINLVQATLKSDNTVYAQLAMDLGAARMVRTANDMGITSRINENPAIVLGGLTYGVSPLEMASAYATLAAQGQHVETTLILKVKDSRGKVLYEAKPKKSKAISARTAYTVTRILEQNVIRGTGGRARLDRPSAGKTGTATDYSDAWYCGFIPQLSTSVWVGHPEGQVPMRSVHGIRVAGGTFPAQIWGSFMRKVERDFPPAYFERPKEDDRPQTTDEELFQRSRRPAPPTTQPPRQSPGFTGTTAPRSTPGFTGTTVPPPTATTAPPAD